MRIRCLVPLETNRRHPRRARARATMCMMGVAMLLMVQLAWAAAAHAQANISLTNNGATGVLATNTDWSIAKNGGFASGTVSWTVGVTKVSVSDQIIEVYGQIPDKQHRYGPGLPRQYHRQSATSLQRGWSICFGGGGRG